VWQWQWLLLVVAAAEPPTWAVAASKEEQERRASEANFHMTAAGASVIVLPMD